LCFLGVDDTDWLLELFDETLEDGAG
jgi:hypothetical protein